MRSALRWQVAWPRVLVDQGDAVRAGQLVADLDPVDLEDRIASGRLAAERAVSTVRAAEAQLAEAQSRAQLAVASARRSAELRAQGFVSQEATDAKGHEANAAKAAVDAAAAQLAAARRDHERAVSDVAGVGKLRAQARLTSPVDGVISARLVEPGTTLVAGQAWYTSSTRRPSGSRRGSTRDRPAACVWASPWRSCCARRRRARIAARSSASTG